MITTLISPPPPPQSAFVWEFVPFLLPVSVVMCFYLRVYFRADVQGMCVECRAGRREMMT